MEIWILTSEYNDYDQHGEYFVAVFGSKPTPKELIAKGVPEADVSLVLQGGGRERGEDIWFHLQKHVIGVDVPGEGKHG